MSKYSPKKKVGVIIGSVASLFLVMGVIGRHTQQPTVNNITTPASTTRASSAPAQSASLTTPDTPSTTNDSNEARTESSDTSLSNNNTYTNIDGNTVHSPADSTNADIPAGATAQCADGTYSFSQHHSGTCSHHGGVAQWL